MTTPWPRAAKTPADIGNELAEFISAELDGRDELEQRIIANRVRKSIEAWIAVEKTPPAIVQPMTDQEARAFELERMEFGKYNGVPVKDVPLDYLFWIADAGRKTWRQIHAYLNSSRIRGELHDGDKRMAPRERPRKERAMNCPAIDTLIQDALLARLGSDPRAHAVLAKGELSDLRRQLDAAQRDGEELKHLHANQMQNAYDQQCRAERLDRELLIARARLGEKPF